jgi:hypothetical protein
MDKILIRGQTLWAWHSWSRRQLVMLEPQFPRDAVGQHKEDARQALPVGQPGPAAARPRRIGRQQQFQHRPQGHRAVRLAIHLLVVAVGIAGCASQDRRKVTAANAVYPGHVVSEEETDKDLVKRLQNRLNEMGCGPIAVDGIFGKNTKHAVMLFQTRQHDRVGKVGPFTWAALYRTSTVP